MNILDLNQMKVRPPREIVKIEAATHDNKYIVKQEPSLADNVLVVGERYQPVDIRSICSTHLGKFTSGVMGNCNLDLFMILNHSCDQF